MDIEFSIKSKKFYEFLCIFSPEAAAAHSHRFCGTDYIKVNISYKLDCDNQVELYKFEISHDTKEKAVPEFINLPLEIQKMMVEKSSSKSYIPFLDDCYIDKSKGGFDWSYTDDGYDFWSDIIDHKNFDTFFKRYPKESFIKTDLKATSGLIAKDFIACGKAVVDGYINYTTEKEVVDKLNEITELLTKNNEKDENQLQGEKIPFGGTDPRPGRVLRGSNKVRVAVKPLGYKKIIGRG